MTVKVYKCITVLETPSAISLTSINLSCRKTAQKYAYIIETIVQKYAYIIETSWITCNYHCSRRDDSPEDPMIYVKIQICGTWYFNDSV